MHRALRARTRATTPDMKLYITPGSPYARMARIVVLEKGLASRVEVIVAKTRAVNSPYYQINPSGRVPFLVRDDGTGLEDSPLICFYLDHLDGKPKFDFPAGVEGTEARRLEALARSLVDGLSVWSRELARPENERSPGVIQHEAERARRMTELWEAEIANPLMRGKLNIVQITLACGLGLEARNPDFRWRPGHPKLCEWFDEIAARPSFTATAPPNAPPTPAHAAERTVQALRPDRAVMTQQRLPYFIGVSGQTVGASGLSMHIVVIPPGARAEPHMHIGYETGIYVLEGRVRTRWGHRLEHEVVSEVGDFLFVPPGVPHEAINLSATETARAVVARNDPAEQDKVEPYNVVAPADGR